MNYFIINSKIKIIKQNKINKYIKKNRNAKNESLKIMRSDWVSLSMNYSSKVVDFSSFNNLIRLEIRLCSGFKFLSS